MTKCTAYCFCGCSVKLKRARRGRLWRCPNCRFLWEILGDAEPGEPVHSAWVLPHRTDIVMRGAERGQLSGPPGRSPSAVRFWGLVDLALCLVAFALVGVGLYTVLRMLGIGG